MNKNVILKTVLGLFFAALLATPYIIDNWKQLSGAGPSAEDRENALERYGFFLEEVSASSGIDFIHRAPQLDARLDHIMPQVASVGASVSIADFNRDGLQDIYLTNSRYGSLNALYRNNGDGTFSDVAEAMGVADLNREGTGTSMGSVWGDYDNDGFEDLMIFKWGRPLLLHNDAGEGFTDVSGQIPFPEWVNSNTAIWFDYNRDGNLDLFMGGYFNEDINLWQLESTEIMPESFEYALNGGRKYLFRNNGDGSFTEVSEQLGLVSPRWSFSASAADLTGNGYPDLVIANDYGVDELFINREGEAFVNSGTDAGMGFSPKSGMNVSFGDVMNQGRMAIYITNISEPGVLIQGNNLWVPSMDEEGLPRFRNLAGNLGIEIGGWSYGAQFGDLNSDGLADLYVANGFVSAEEGTDYWYDFSKVAGGNRAIISDARNWPAMEGRSLSGYQENKIWLNDGAGQFQEVAAAVGGSLKLDSRAVAYADLWNRGALDILVASQGGPLRVYRNTVAPGNRWVAFRLEGTESNRSAIGAEVHLFWEGRRQLQVVSGGSGFSSQSQRPLFFGLGTASRVDSAVIQWPSGRRQVLHRPALDTLHTIEEQQP